MCIISRRLEILECTSLNTFEVTAKFVKLKLTLFIRTCRVCLHPTRVALKNKVFFKVFRLHLHVTYLLFQSFT